MAHGIGPAEAEAMRDRLTIAAVLAANGISLLGNVFAALAIPWFVLEETGSALQTGIAAVFASMPLAVGAFFGGAITDRIGARRASIFGDLLSGVSVAGIAGLHAAGVLEFWHVLVLAFAGSFFDAPAAAAREAMLPEITKRAGLRIDQVTPAITATEHGAYLIGAPLAGFLIVVIGAPALLVLDGFSFALSALIVALAAVPHVRGPRHAASAYGGELLEGLRFIGSRSGLLVVTLAATAGAFFIDPLSPVLLPIYAKQQFDDASALGLALGAYGVGGLAGIGLVAVMMSRIKRPLLYRSLWVAYAVASFGLVFVPRLTPLLVVLVVIGITVGAIDPIERAVRQEQTPAALRGRVFAAIYAVPKVVVPLGVFTAGALIEAFGLRVALLIFALGNAVIAAAIALMPAVRSIASGISFEGGAANEGGRASLRGSDRPARGSAGRADGGAGR
jgi:MFS family permease